MRPHHEPPQSGARVTDARRAARMRPHHDPLPSRTGKQPVSAIMRITSRRRPPGKTDGEACPVKPDRPLDLSGGAAAALEFGD